MIMNKNKSNENLLLGAIPSLKAGAFTPLALTRRFSDSIFALKGGALNPGRKLSKSSGGAQIFRIETEKL